MRILQAIMGDSNLSFLPSGQSHSVLSLPDIMAACTGKYKLTHSENFEEFMKALGVGLVTRKLGNKSSPVVTITEEAGEFTMKQESLVKTSEIKFRIGQEFDEVTADGRQGKS